MRTQQQINLIKKSQSLPCVFHDVVDTEKLLEYYFSNQEAIVKKNTGPSILKVSPEDKTFAPVLDLLQKKVGPFEVRYMHYFDVKHPHIIHNDDEFNLPNCYKAFTIPLKIYGNSDDVKLVIFDQYYYGGPAKFVNGENTQNFPVHYNTFVNNYQDLENLSNSKINAKFKEDYLSHISDKWLEGLSVNKLLDWKIGDILCFDSLALHCSTDFTSKNISRKIGLSIFTVR